MVLSLERLGADVAHILALITVCEFMFGKGTGVVECLVTEGTAGYLSGPSLGWPSLGPGDMAADP